MHIPSDPCILLLHVLAEGLISSAWLPLPQCKTTAFATHNSQAHLFRSSCSSWTACFGPAALLAISAARFVPACLRLAHKGFASPSCLRHHTLLPIRHAAIACLPHHSSSSFPSAGHLSSSYPTPRHMRCLLSLVSSIHFGRGPRHLSQLKTVMPPLRRAVLLIAAQGPSAPRGCPTTLLLHRQLMRSTVHSVAGNSPSSSAPASGRCSFAPTLAPPSRPAWGGSRFVLPPRLSHREPLCASAPPESPRAALCFLPA